MNYSIEFRIDYGMEKHRLACYLEYVTLFENL